MTENTLASHPRANLLQLALKLQHRHRHLCFRNTSLDKSVSVDRTKMTATFRTMVAPGTADSSLRVPPRDCALATNK